MPNVNKASKEDYFKGRDWIHQLGFYAPDWRKFAIEHNKLFGSGPFLYTTNTFGKLLYYGDEVDCSALEFRAAYGAWGTHSIEVVEQNDLSVPTMFTELNDTSKPGLNHIHMFVDDLGEAADTCEFLHIPVITAGFPNLENALEKARAANVSEAAVRANCDKPSFLVVDMRKDLGFAVQLVEPRARKLHEVIVGLRDGWNGEANEMFVPMDSLRRR